MSRRARRRRGGGKESKPWMVRGLVLVGVLLVVVFGGGYVWLRSWLHSEDFRVMLSNEAGKALGAKSEFGRFRWDGTSVGSESFDAEGEGLVDELHADALKLEIGLGRVRKGVVEIRDAKLNQLEVVLDLRGDQAEKPLPGEVAEVEQVTREREAWYSGLLPSEVELTDLEVVRSSLTLHTDDGEAKFSGTRWKVLPDGHQGGYKIRADGGMIELPWDYLPSLDLRRGQMRFQDLTVFVTDSEFSVYESGRLDLTGEASLRGDGFSFVGRLYDVMAIEVLPEDWKQRLTGRLESEFSVGDSGQGLGVDGSLELFNGSLTALPVLDHLAAYGGNPRFRQLSLNDARADYYWKDGDLTVSNIELGSDGLIRLEGLLRMDKDDRLDGRFKLGLAPGTLARIPGAETKVFHPGESGLLWTPLRITGTLDDPQEDLTDRLIAAAGERMFELLPETGEKVLKFTRHVVSGDLDSAIDQGKVVIDQGSELLDTGKALIDGKGGVLPDADEVIRQAEDVVKGVDGIFGIFDDDPPEPEEEEPTPVEEKQPE